MTSAERELSLRTADLTIMLARHPMELTLIAAATAKVEALRHQIDGEAVAISQDVAAMTRIAADLRAAAEAMARDRARLDAVEALVLLGTAHGLPLSEGERLRAMVARQRGDQIADTHGLAAAGDPMRADGEAAL